MRSDIFDKILAETPKDLTQFIDNSMDFVLIINNILKIKGISKKELAKKIGIEEVNLTKWLSVGYNLTLREISKIEFELGEKIIFKNHKL